MGREGVGLRRLPAAQSTQGTGSTKAVQCPGAADRHPWRQRITAGDIAMPAPAVSREATNTVVVGAGQAGLATSYWLAQRGVEHRLLERRPALGGAWQDRWDSFYLNTPNFSLALPGTSYAGPEPDGFTPRDAT